MSSFDSSISGSGRFFLFFPFLVVKFLWWLWLKCCCIVVLQTNGIQCVKKSMHVLYFTSNNLRKESQFHVTVCLKCKSFKSHSAKYHAINLIRFVFCISQGDDHSLKEGKVCLQVLNTHKLRICLPNSSFRARTFLKSFVPRKRAF